jgi:hypothetical protein
MNASDVEVGDTVMVYGIKTGKVVHFLVLSASSAGIFSTP